jgi:hypothetical protein
MECFTRLHADINHDGEANIMRKGISLILSIILTIVVISIVIIFFYSTKTGPKISETVTSPKTGPKIGKPPLAYVITSETNDGVWRRVLKEYVRGNLTKIEVLSGPETPSLQYIKNWQERPSKAIYYFCGKTFDANVGDYIWVCVNESTPRIRPLLSDPPLHVFALASSVLKETKNIINRVADCYTAFQGETTTTLCFDKETNILLDWRIKTKLGDIINEGYTTVISLNLTTPSEEEFMPPTQPIDCISKSDCPI